MTKLNDNNKIKPLKGYKRIYCIRHLFWALVLATSLIVIVACLTVFFPQYFKDTIDYFKAFGTSAAQRDVFKYFLDN
jgi:hypothetical protein